MTTNKSLSQNTKISDPGKAIIMRMFGSIVNTIDKSKKMASDTEIENDLNKLFRTELRVIVRE